MDLLSFVVRVIDSTNVFVILHSIILVVILTNSSLCYLFHLPLSSDILPSPLFWNTVSIHAFCSLQWETNSTFVHCNKESYWLCHLICTLVNKHYR